MEYQKIINLLINTPNQPSKFKTKNWVEINYESRGTCNEDNQIRFQTSMLRSGLCDYSHAYILVKGTMLAENKAVQYQPNNGTNKMVIFKNCAPFTNCISKLNNTQVDDVHDIGLVMPMYNIIQYSNNYSKTSGILRQYCRDEAALADDNTTIADFTEANSITGLFKIKEKYRVKQATMAQKILK